jgi:hypothetical protein
LYVLPWGQMSYWAAVVITNLFSAIPLVGPSIVEWLWGGFSVLLAALDLDFKLKTLLNAGNSSNFLCFFDFGYESLIPIMAVKLPKKRGQSAGVR